MTPRRHALFRLLTSAAALAFPAVGRSAQRRSLADPMRLAVDDALADSGFASHLQRSFGRDTGVAIQLLRGPATSVLEALERGEHDATLTNAPTVEMGLEKQGFAHDRRLIATSEFIVVGPKALAKALDARRDVAVGLSRLAQVQAPFISRADGSGTYLTELALWRAAQVAPAAPWYISAAAGAPLLMLAREHQACLLVERGTWGALGGVTGYGVLVEGDPRLAVDVHIMRGFRTQHPAAKLFSTWISGNKGRQVVASHHGYRVPPR